jgi:hypothetical protein
MWAPAAGALGGSELRSSQPGTAGGIKGVGATAIDGLWLEAFGAAAASGLRGGGGRWSPGQRGPMVSGAAAAGGLRGDSGRWRVAVQARG